MNVWTSPVRTRASPPVSRTDATGLAATEWESSPLTPSTVALIVTAPGPVPRTFPKASTVATDSSELDQATSG